MREKWQWAKSAFREGKILHSALMLSYLPLHGYRYLRGYPTPRGI